MAGGIVIAAVIIYVVYKQMITSTGQASNSTMGTASNGINASVFTEINKI